MPLLRIALGVFTFKIEKNIRNNYVRKYDGEYVL